MTLRYAAFVFALGVAGVTAGCTGKNIHSDLKADPRVLVRQGTFQTRGQAESVDRGSEYSNPAFSENTLIFGNQSTGLICLYPSFNQVRWVLPIDGGVISPLTIEGGNAYFTGGDGFLYSANAENGRVNWRYELRNPVVSKPTLNGGRLFVTTSDDVVYAFDAGTGKWLWHYRRRTSPVATIYGASAPLIEGNEVLVGLSDGFLVSLSVNDGQLKWERKLHQGTKFTDIDAAPVVEQGVLYVPSYDGALYALKRQGGDVLWRFDVGGSKQVVLEEQRLFLPGSDGSIYALQKNNAKVLWKFELDGGTPTQLIVTDRHVIAGSSFQYLYVIDKNTGKGLYRYNVGYESGFYGSPSLDPSGKRFYILSSVGNLYAFDIRPFREPKKFSAAEPYL